MRKRICYITAMLLLPLVLLCSACDREDDVEGIFTGNDWKWAFYRYNGVLAPSQNRIYALNFGAQSFTLTTPSNAVIGGTWQADATGRTFACSRVQVTQGSLAGDTVAQRLRQMLIEAVRYAGDDNTLQLYDSHNNLMQFYSKNP